MESKIVFTSLHNFDYEVLAELTLHKNKKIYCEKHGYPLVFKNDNWHNICIGFEKAYVIKDAFEKHPLCEWVFMAECDTLITNMNIKLEDILKDEKKHVVVTSDCNGINAGNFFVRNTIEGKEFIQSMIDSISAYPHEQAFIIDSYFGSKKYTDIMSMYPQKIFNSYDYYIYGNAYPHGLDMFGNNGRWEDGDFIIHWPGTSLQHRLNLANEYLLKVKCTGETCSTIEQIASVDPAAPV